MADTKYRWRLKRKKSVCLDLPLHLARGSLGLVQAAVGIWVLFLYLAVIDVLADREADTKY